MRAERHQPEDDDRVAHHRGHQQQDVGLVGEVGHQEKGSQKETFQGDGAEEGQFVVALRAWGTRNEGSGYVSFRVVRVFACDFFSHQDA